MCAIQTVEVDEGFCSKDGLSRLTKESARKVSFCGDRGLRSCYGSFADCRAYATLGTIRKTLGVGETHPQRDKGGKARLMR